MKEKYYQQQMQIMALGCSTCDPVITGRPALQNISGVVVDEDNQPVPGVNVTIENTSTGVMTDFDGKFSLNNVPATANIDFSYQTLITKIPAHSASGTIKINTIGSLDEVIVIAPKRPDYLKYMGYGLLALVVLYGFSRIGGEKKTVKASI